MCQKEMAQSGKLLMDVKAMVMKLGIGLCGSAKADFANQLDFHEKDISPLKGLSRNSKTGLSVTNAL